MQAASSRRRGSEARMARSQALLLGLVGLQRLAPMD
jgi:hypothetical protein